MANKEYYERWLKIKKQINIAVTEDKRLQELASNLVGIKPQATAVEIVSRTYGKYCDIYNKLCDCYDQMEQAQRRPFLKKIIDAVTCRILELKTTLEEVEVFEFTYPENALQQMLMTPQDIQVMCPFFYPFEIRQKEMQYIIDEIFAGNRLGDPEPTPSELERAEERRLEEEELKRAEKEAEIRKKLALGEDIPESVDEIIYTPAQLEAMRRQEEYLTHINNIQRMERSRVTTKAIVRKFYKDLTLYLELSGEKKPQAKENLRQKAAVLIQFVYRTYMQLKRDHHRDYKMKKKLGMIIESWKPESAKVQLEKVKEVRRSFRRKYHEEWIQQNIKEKSRVLRLREGDIMEDITTEIKAWLQDWYDQVRIFDEFPYAEEGGSILIVQGQTFTIDEYLDWLEAEKRRIKIEAGNPKGKEDIKAEKLWAKEEKKRLAAEAKLREKKRIREYKKSRLNPEGDPGIHLKFGRAFQPVVDAWHSYECQWKGIDFPDASLNVIKGYIMGIITENVYRDINLELRPIVDDIIRMELKLLQASLKLDYEQAGVPKPMNKKRKKPKKPKPPKHDRLRPEVMFQRLVDGGIVKKYPRTTLDDYWGDQNFAAADTRAVLWTPSFPPPCLGDVREQVRVRCILTLGSRCRHAARSQLVVGPKSSGKRTLVYAIATETNSILIDLSPMNVYNKFSGPRNFRIMLAYVNKISRIMQPTVILVDNAEKIFYKKVPKEEKLFDPTRLSKDLFKQIIKPLGHDDKILVLGTATEPWLAKTSAMFKAFPSTILLPPTDYASISFILTQVLMKYHGIEREFNVHSLAQALKGYNIHTIRKAIETLMTSERIAALYYKPLDPMEILSIILESEETVVTEDADYQLYKEWYMTYSPMGLKYLEYMIMLDSQLAFKIKADKKKKKP